MTRENAKDLLPVVQAYAEGKVIQMRRNADASWEDITQDDLNFCCEPEYYRIKPEETYRPYKDCEEMIADFKKRFGVIVPPCMKPLVWVKKKTTKDVLLVTWLDDSYDGYLADVDASWKTATELFEDFTYLDDSTCGVKE